MHFNIDTTKEYICICPDTTLIDAKFSELLTAKCQELSKTDSPNFIIDLSKCTAIDPNFLEPLIETAATFYEQEQSFVIACPPPAFTQYLKEVDAIDALNYGPTFIEALDIVKMDIVARDFLQDDL